jgi:hypothetical protein
MTEDGNRHSGHFRDHARLPITAGHRLRPTSGTPQGTRPAAHPCAGLAARVRRERADAIAAYQAEIALRARHARITAARSGSHLGPVLYG